MQVKFQKKLSFSANLKPKTPFLSLFQLLLNSYIKNRQILIIIISTGMKKKQRKQLAQLNFLLKDNKVTFEKNNLLQVVRQSIFLSLGKVRSALDYLQNNYKHIALQSKQNHCDKNLFDKIKNIYQQNRDCVTKQQNYKHGQNGNSMKMKVQEYMDYLIESKLKQKQQKEQITYKFKRFTPDISQYQPKQLSQNNNYFVNNKYFQNIQFFRQLGRGANAVVKSAIDWKNNRKIAVKLYFKQKIKKNQFSNIKREISILNQIKHPNIAALYQTIQTKDYVHTSSKINLILQYGGGNSLYQFLKVSKNCRLQESEAKFIFKQILQAIKYIHSKNIVHRDIKPQNILLNKHKKVKLIDFGFSIISPIYQKVKSFCGTPTYMAPQIVSKREHVGMYADMWSLGILLYIMLQGSYPFKGKTEKQLFKKIIKGNFEYVNSISEQAKKVIQSLIRVDPAERSSLQQVCESAWIRNQ